MTHLGSQISALVDGQLPPHQAERALAHIACCPACAAELASARAARRALSAARDLPVDPQLTARLMALGRTDPADASGHTAQGAVRRPEDAARAWPFEHGSVPLPGSAGHRQMPGNCLHGDLRRRSLPARGLALAAVGAGAAVMTLFVLGQEPHVAPVAHPAHALTLLGRAGTAPSDVAGSGVHDGSGARDGAGTQGTAGGAPATAALGLAPSAPPAQVPATVDGPDETLAWLEARDWAAPSALPEGFRLTGVRTDVDGSAALELDLVGPDGLVVITEQHGRLDPQAVGGAPVVELGGREVHVLSRAPWHGVWQVGDTVVSVVAEEPSTSVEALVAAYPDETYDAGVAARIARGWHVLTGAWDS